MVYLSRCFDIFRSNADRFNSHTYTDIYLEGESLIKSMVSSAWRHFKLANKDHCKQEIEKYNFVLKMPKKQMTN